jgi:hypothetical protein
MSDFFNVPPLQDEPAKEKKPVSFYRVRLSDKILEFPLLKQGDATLCSRQNISVIKAPAKSAKTFLTSILMSSFLGNKSFDLSTPVMNGTILCIDTEQANSTVLKCLKRVHTISDIDQEDDRLVFLSVNEMSTSELIDLLRDAIEFYKPDLVILDGTVDLVTNFNDILESSTVVTIIRQLAIKHNLHIVNVLHEGKGNGEIRGHLGSFIKNKCETVFQIKKDGDLVSVSADATRHKPFLDWSFLINEDGLPVYNGEVIPGPKERKATKTPQSILTSTHEQILVQVFDIAAEQTYKQLRENIQERFATVVGTSLGITLGEQFVAFYKNNGFVIAVPKGRNDVYKIGNLVINSQP